MCFVINPRILIMTSVLLLPDHRPMRAKSIADAPNVKDIVNNPVTRHVPRLDGQIDEISVYPHYCGNHADIYAGILHGAMDVGTGVWTASSSRNITVGTVHVYSVPPPHGQRRASRWPSKSFEMPTRNSQLQQLKRNIQRRVNRALFFKFLFDPNIRFCKSYIKRGHLPCIQIYCPCLDWLMTQQSVLLGL